MSNNPIRMVNTTCTHCNSSIDQPIDKPQIYCPFCGAELMISITQVQDILFGKKKYKEDKVIYRKDVKYYDESLTKKKKISAAVVLLIFIMLCAITALLARFRPLF